MVPRQNAKVLVVANGAYGDRQAKMCQTAGIPFTKLNYKDNERVQVDDIRVMLRE